MLKYLFTVLLTFFILLGSMTILCYFVDKHQCFKNYKDFNPSYSFPAGCVVEYNNITIPANSLRINID